MKGLTKIILGLMLSLLFSVVCIGYAQVSDVLTVEGSAEADAQKNVFISEVRQVQGTSQINGQYGTILKSVVDLSTSEVTLEIDVYNNSDYVFIYNGSLYDLGDETYSNSNIEFAVSGIKKGDEITAHSSLTFTVKFSYAYGTSQADSILKSAINFQFVPHEDYIPEIAVGGALDQFEEILNTVIDYDALIQYMEDTSGTNRPNGSYIGNVVGANDKDSAFLNEIFTVEGENMLVLDINGEKTNVTAMIKRENLDSNSATGDSSGNEMTIYLTAEDINVPWYQSKTVVVYAAVFTKYSTDGEWVQITDLYEGTANANNYNGSYFSTKNSFNTDTWKSSKEYHGVAAGATIETLVAQSGS